MLSIYKSVILACLLLGSANGLANSKVEMIQIQKKLKELGYNPGPIDGVKGEGTEAAIIDFQKSLRVNVNGEITSSLIDSLSSPCKRSFIQGQSVKVGACKKAIKSNNGSEIWQAKPGEEPIEIVFE